MNQPAGEVQGRHQSTDLEVAAHLLIASAHALEQRVAETASGRGFDNAVGDFARLLGTVTDSAPRAMGDDDVAAFRGLAESGD